MMLFIVGLVTLPFGILVWAIRNRSAFGVAAATVLAVVAAAFLVLGFIT